jgi:hypothetical protein
MVEARPKETTSMKKFYICLTALAVLALTFMARPAQAHHSFTAEFDGTKTITLEGVITKMDWINPHGWWRVDVPGPNGEVQHWDIQTESPAALRQAGMTRDKNGKPGDKVKILAYGAKDGTKNLAIVRTITFESGDMAGQSFRLFDLLDRQNEGVPGEKQ